MNKKISQFDLTTSLGDNDLITLVQNGENKNITKATLEYELADTFVADSELEEQITDLTDDLEALEKKHDEAIDDITDVVQDWTDELSIRPTANQLQDVLNRVIINENKITKLAEAIANGEVGEGGGGSSDSGIVGPHSQSTATIFPLTGYVKDVNADPLDSSDTLNEALSKLENKIDNIAANGGAGGGLNMPLIKTNETTNATGNDGALFTAGAVEERFLNASGDIAKGKLTLMQGFQAGNEFRSGWDGEGASLYSIDKNKWNLELDNLFVRGNMTVNELTVNEIKAVGGDILVTIADIECVNVVDSSEGWLCYFKDEDGYTFSGFKALDQAICQKFDGKNVKRYWRTVLSVNEEDNYIVLSKTQCESEDNGIPEVGDKILQLGHRADTSLTPEELAARRNAIFISAKGENSPRITFYKNIDNFTLVGKDTTVIGTESKFVGTFTQVASNGDYVRVPTYRGKWVAAATYNYYDQVTHNGSLWICMENDVIASEPSTNNSKWQIQVQKGEPGTSGDDTAKFIEITGDRLFLYDTTDYTGTPTPEKIILYVTSHGISEEATYKWTLQGDSYVELGIGTTLEVNPNMFTGKSATIRCTAYEGEASVPYYDDFQIAKLSNGENTYYIDLSNSNVSVPYDYDYTTPLLPLSTFYTEVYTYYGTKPVEVSSIDTITVSGTATAVVDGNVVRLHSLNSGSAKIRINVTLSNGETIHKDWFITRIRSGKDGGSGADAAYVMVAGEQIFKSLQGSTTEFVPSSITLSAMAYNIIEPTYKWYWSFPGSGEWHIIENATSNEYELYPTTSYFANVNEISIKCEAVAKTGGNTYYDVISINKISDGIDGTGTYHGILTNEMHTVASTYLGEVIDEELNRAKTSIKLYYQTELLGNDSFTWTATSISECSSKYWQEDYNNYTLKLISMPTDTVVLRVHFLVNGKEVDACDFTVTKAKAGVPGDFEVSVYAAVDEEITSLVAPAFSEIPSASGILGSDGVIWFVDVPITSSKVVWRSVGLFDGATSLLKEGSTWTTPVIFQGTNGKPGDPGRGIISITEYYAISSSSTTAPSSGWTTSVKTPTSTSKYLWNREDILYSDSNTAITGTPRVISVYGDTGNPGRGISSVVEYYARGGSSRPASNSFSTSVPTLTASYPNLWNYTLIKYTDGTTNGATYTNAIIIGSRGADGSPGNPGDQGPAGPAMNFRGEYSSSASYYRTTNRVDVVKSGSTYYMVYPGRNDFRGKSPSSYSVSDGTTSTTAYWVKMSSFEMLATGLLLAEEATIAGWIFDPNGYLRSQNNMVCLNGNPNNSTASIALGQASPGFVNGKINGDANMVLYQSGTIQLGGGTCGISGAPVDTAHQLKVNGVARGNTRFWAGSGRTNGASNNFVVTDTGFLYAADGCFKGSLQVGTSGESNDHMYINANSKVKVGDYTKIPYLDIRGNGAIIRTSTPTVDTSENTVALQLASLSTKATGPAFSLVGEGNLFWTSNSSSIWDAPGVLGVWTFNNVTSTPIKVSTVCRMGASYLSTCTRNSTGKFTITKVNCSAATYPIVIAGGNWIESYSSSTGYAHITSNTTDKFVVQFRNGGDACDTGFTVILVGYNYGDFSEWN